MSNTCCANCEYWEQFSNYWWNPDKAVAKPYGYCRAVSEVESLPDVDSEPDDIQAWAIGAEYDGQLLTRAKFFCAMFEEKQP